MLKSLPAAETLSAWSYCLASDSERPSTLLSGTSVSDDRQRPSVLVWPRPLTKLMGGIHSFSWPLHSCIFSALFRNLRFLEIAQRFLRILRKRGLSRESAVTESATDTALSKV